MVLKYSGIISAPIDIINRRLLDTKLDNLVELKLNDILIIAVICNHCPFVLNLKNKLSLVLNKFYHSGFNVYAISGNDPLQYPEDSPEFMREFAKDFDFPYLYDESQEFLKSLQAECTPEFYVFKDRKLKYHGRFDDSTPSNGLEVTGKDLIAAVKNIALDLEVSQFQAVGCSIKWR